MALSVLEVLEELLQRNAELSALDVAERLVGADLGSGEQDTDVTLLLLWCGDTLDSRAENSERDKTIRSTWKAITNPYVVRVVAEWAEREFS